MKVEELKNRRTIYSKRTPTEFRLRKNNQQFSQVPNNLQVKYIIGFSQICENWHVSNYEKDDNSLSPKFELKK